MDLNSISLNALRAFEAAARYLNFTHAADELCVTQAAVSHQVKLLESQIGSPLFLRTSRGLVFTDEGAALYPAVAQSLRQIERAVRIVGGEERREVLTVGVVGTFAAGILLEHLPRFSERHPQVDVRLQLNNNAVDLATEGLDLAIRFGDGSWHGVSSERLMAAPMAPMCSPRLAQCIGTAADLVRYPLLQSYRRQDWPDWFKSAGIAGKRADGPVFDSSHLMAVCAMRGLGVALLPVAMFEKELRTNQLAIPITHQIDCGSYWLTRLASRSASDAATTFSDWLFDVCAAFRSRRSADSCCRAANPRV